MRNVWRRFTTEDPLGKGYLIFQFQRRGGKKNYGSSKTLLAVAHELILRAALRLCNSGSATNVSRVA